VSQKQRSKPRASTKKIIENLGYLYDENAHFNAVGERDYFKSGVGKKKGMTGRIQNRIYIFKQEHLTKNEKRYRHLKIGATSKSTCLKHLINLGYLEKRNNKGELNDRGYYYSFKDWVGMEDKEVNEYNIALSVDIEDDNEKSENKVEPNNIRNTMADKKVLKIEEERDILNEKNIRFEINEHYKEKTNNFNIDTIQLNLEYLIRLVDIHLSIDYFSTLTEQDMIFIKDIGKGAGQLETENEWEATCIKGNIAFLQQDFEEARMLFVKSMNIAEGLKEDRKIANSYYFISNYYFKMGKDSSSLEWCNRALKLFEKLRDIQKMAFILKKIGIIYKNRCEFKIAEKYFKKAKIMFEKDDMNKYSFEAIDTINNLGQISIKRGEHAIALLQFKRATVTKPRDDFPAIFKYKESIKNEVDNKNLDDFITINHNRQLYAMILSSYAYLDKVFGRYLSAQNYCMDSIQILKEINDDKIGVAQVKLSLADILWKQGKYEESLNNFKVSIDIIDQIGGNLNIAYAKREIGKLYLYTESENAPICFKESMNLFKIYGEVFESYISKQYLPLYFIKKNDYDQAHFLCKRNLSFSNKIGYKTGIAIDKYQLGVVNMKKDCSEEAKDFFSGALNIAEQIGYKELVARIYYQIANRLYSISLQKQSEDYFKKGLMIANDIGHLELIEDFHLSLYNYYQNQHNTKKYTRKHGYFLKNMKKINLHELINKNLFWINEKNKKLTKKIKTSL